MANPWLEAALIALTSVVAAIVGLLVIWFAIGRRRAHQLDRGEAAALEETVYLFEDQTLVDATAPARQLLEATPMGQSDWARLSAFVAPRFTNFAERIAMLAQNGRIEMTETVDGLGEGRLRLIAEDVGGLARITLVDPQAEGRGVRVDGLSQRALEDELELMRVTLDRSPVLIWRSDPSGSISWANRAYLVKSGAFDANEDGFAWPLPCLFQCPKDMGTGPHRLQQAGMTGDAGWYECHSLPVKGGALHFAIPADATVRAEKALRDFVQTLTKTFADLPIGLAIFDRDRQLRLFNPALIDLLQLGPEFLSARPTLYAFLDRLRETRMMPEPKDYRSWRLRMTELEQAAASGFHAETWNLSGGQTYRVTGRPHPDGAVAFLFEDISAETSLTRRFRGEIEMGQEVLDQIDDAIAVFHPSGELAMANAGYCALWGVEPETTLGRVTLRDAVAQWRAQAEPSVVWDRLHALTQQIGTRAALDAEIVLRDGRSLRCRLSTLTGGAFLLRFSAPALPQGQKGVRDGKSLIPSG
ncbi:PAS-domain containing protein [Thioclava atlantica]|uniref:PAS/PAC sensor domain-containing protein n=1 Tax=Thioclava atlantica TaxID=1317124 RepID=A0A085TWX7_9RHOB|nr:PAS-domain containing protein [Thioclava atlantica]KFE35224.1 PAS/PAC sensor domain-containing protein [Thioclava atlantica]